MFDFDLSDELKLKIRKLLKKDRKKVRMINKKIIEITGSSPDTIDHYKNLKGNLKEYRRVHIATHFVLTFKVDKKKNFILFVDFEHHDKAY